MVVALCVLVASSKKQHISKFFLENIHHFLVFDLMKRYEVSQCVPQSPA